MKILEKIDNYLAEQTGEKAAYQALFKKLAAKHGFKPEEVDDLPKDKKKAFFDELDKKWKADKETD